MVIETGRPVPEVAGQHGVAGERATAQARRALVAAFTGRPGI
ncbi:hypothetical protein FHS36_005343 [Streptomyces eurocidicus]|uniref:Uncharacterized protein n=1 Tax=Streptomyces eurocidicus TaxID=66423 RepID=A0A7W8BHZ6_STREU|nr:hypothetical protein [Streptomyces eurocidicus]